MVVKQFTMFSLKLWLGLGGFVIVSALGSVTFQNKMYQYPNYVVSPGNTFFVTQSGRLMGGPTRGEAVFSN